MSRNLMIGIAVVAVVAVAAYVILGYDGGDTGTEQHHSYTAYEESDIRLTVYGNANGDDVIDQTDVDVLRQIIDEGDAGWRDKYVYADANQDGEITEADISVVNHFLTGQKERMYYYNYFDRVTYVNFPIGHKIGCEFLTPTLLMADHAYDYLCGITDDLKSFSAGSSTYPGTSEMPSLGTGDEFTVESLESTGIDAIVMWTGGGAQDYFWDRAHAAGLADKMSIVMVPTQGREVINGALIFAAMLGNQSLSDDYREWYDDAMKLIDRLNSGEIQKKTVTCVAGLYYVHQDNLWAFGSQLSPALWFNEVVDFQPQYVGKGTQTPLGYEGFVDSATDEVIVMLMRESGVTFDNFNRYVEDRFEELFENTRQYENQTLYGIEWDIMPSFGGPAGCYILAAYLYPEHFDLADAFDFAQEYLDKFVPIDGLDARRGFAYTGDGYGPDPGLKDWNP